MVAFTGTFKAHETRPGGGPPPPVQISVAPGSVQTVPSSDPNVVAAPTTAWLTGEVATFTDGPFHWNGAGWAAGPAADAEPEADTEAAPRSDWTVPKLDEWAAEHADIAPDYPVDGKKPEKLAYIQSVTEAD